MTSIANSIPSLRLQPQLSYSLRSSISHSRGTTLNPSIARVFQCDAVRLSWNRRRPSWIFRVRASDGTSPGSAKVAGAPAFKEMVGALQPAVLVVQRNVTSKYAVGIYITFAVFAVIVRQVTVKKRSRSHQGSVADLVRRGQLRPDRRGISKPLQYEDPFNNPLVKVGKSDSTIEMCGKVYRLAPVTLTEDQQSEHQKRRSRVYQWKRPKVFLKEGEVIPPDVDPDSVRWLPANHPFATTDSDIDEKIAQQNISQKHGVPSLVRAEHEALQKKLEALQSGQDFNAAAVNHRSIQGSEGAVQSSLKPPKPIVPIPPTIQQQQHTNITSDPNPEVGSN